MHLRIEFCQFSHIVVPINLLLINHSEAHSLLCNRARVHFFLHGSLHRNYIALITRVDYDIKLTIAINR